MSNLIADRNKARYDVAKDNKSATKKTSVKPSKSSATKSRSKQDELTTTILYEQKIKVVGTESGRTLANGVAYINKKGQIVRIKISKE